MGILYDTLVDLSEKHDEEMLDGFRRYEEEITDTLTPEQIEHYVHHLQTTQEVRIFDDMTPEEIAHLPGDMPQIATAIMADNNSNMENRRVVALLSQRGEFDIAPDYE